MKKISVIGATYWEQQCCAPRRYRFIYTKTKVCLCPWTRRKHISLLVRPVEAAKLVATDKKTRHAFKRECKQAWKAQKKAA